MGATYAQTGLDLSERQLTYFAYHAALDYALNQEGEDAHCTGNNPNFAFELGGQVAYVMTLFSAGIGPFYEEIIPYQNEEDIILCKGEEAGFRR